MNQQEHTTRWTRGRAASLVLLMAGVVTMGAGVRPARADLFTPSVADQIHAGDDAARQIERQYPVLHDDRAAHLQETGDRLLDALDKDRGPWHWSFSLVQSKELNAFALPGGHVFFFTGLYDRIHDDNALAAVVGHEMTHVLRQHWAHQVADQQKRELGLLGLLTILHANNSWGTVADLGDQLLNLKYSRGDERQADEGGLNLMTKAGYAPCGMIRLFHILQQAGGGGGVSFLSDHPLTSDRIKAARDQIRKMGYGNCPE